MKFRVPGWQPQTTTSFPSTAFRLLLFTLPSSPSPSFRSTHSHNARRNTTLRALRPSSLPRRASNGPRSQGSSPLLASNLQIYHKLCLKCDNCGKRLDQGSLVQHDNQVRTHPMLADASRTVHDATPSSSAQETSDTQTTSLHHQRPANPHLGNQQI